MADLSQMSNADLMAALGQQPSMQSEPLQSMSDADLMRALGPQPAAQSSGTLTDIGKSALSGLETGATGLAGLPGDIRSGLSSASSYVMNKMGYTPTQADNFKNMASAAFGGLSRLPTSQQVQDKVNSVTGTTPYQPQTTAGEYARTIGQFAPGVIGGGASLPMRLATQVVAPAVASEAAGQAARILAPEAEPYARIAGAVVAPSLVSAASRVLSPTNVSAENANAVKTLNDAGVTALTAGQKSGSRVLKYMESELGDSLGAGGKATAANEAAMQQFTSAALKRAGVAAPRATPDVIDSAFAANSDAFNSVAARNPAIKLPPAFWNEADNVANEYKGLTGQSSPLIAQLIDKLKSSTQGAATWPAKFQKVASQLKAQGISDADIAATLGAKPVPGSAQAISGEAYQSVQSDIARLARKASQPELKNALYDLRSALDQGVATGLKQAGNPQDYAAWQGARQQYKNLLVIERALAKDSESAANGLITPAALGQASRAITGKRAFVRGNDTYSDLARAGNAVMKPLPQSGTAPRAAAHMIPAVLGAGLGALGGHLGGEHLLGMAAGVAAPAVLGRSIMSRPVQVYLSNQLATPLRQIPIAPNMIRGGLLGLPAAYQQRQIP